jgi:hypothetical protein
MGKDFKLNRIQQYFDTKGKRLSAKDKELVCKVLDDKDKYNNFNRVIETSDSGRDYRDTWSTHTVENFKIEVDENNFQIKHSEDYSCDDGFTRHSDTIYSDVREVINALKRIFGE